MKIIIFGGSFDPIHLGHIEVAKNSLKAINGDKIWLLPAPLARFKTTKTTIDERIEMLNLVVKHEKDFALNLSEVNQEGAVRTYDTIKKIKSDDEFYFLIGADQAIQLDKWYKGEELSKMIQFLVYPRPNYQIGIDVIKKYRLQIIDSELKDISSTYIRNSLDFTVLPKYLRDYLLATLIYHQQLLSELISEHRYLHSLRVKEVAVELAKIHGIDVKNAALAALLHDCAKDITDQISGGFIAHQFYGAQIAEYVFKVQDEDVLNAIAFHTTGRKKMTPLMKLVFIADKIEPGRMYDSSQLKKLCSEDLDKGFRAVVTDYAKYLKRKNIEVCGDARECILEYGEEYGTN